MPISVEILLLCVVLYRAVVLTRHSERRAAGMRATRTVRMADPLPRRSQPMTERRDRAA